MRISNARAAARMRAAAALASASLAACSTFGAVRSAEVRPGLGATLTASASAPVGDAAGWFYSLDCVERCSDQVLGVGGEVSYGWERAIGGRPTSVAVGTSGVYPYVDGFVQLREGGAPFGAGARIGMPGPSWGEYQLYARLDVPLGRSTRLLLDPGLFMLAGSSPNGANDGSIIAFVQGAGLDFDLGGFGITPAVSLVAGHAQHSVAGRAAERGAAFFPVASIAFSVR
jgi:hypothetical protein